MGTMATFCATKKEKALQRTLWRQAFSSFVSKLNCTTHMEGTRCANDATLNSWCCCLQIFTNLVDIQRHVSRYHSSEVTSLISQLEDEHSEDSTNEIISRVETIDAVLEMTDHDKIRDSLMEKMSIWKNDGNEVSGFVVLFYKYTSIPVPQTVASWQKTLCERLNLTGKVRVALEGINATVGGSMQAIIEYVSKVISHPFPHQISLEDVKTSPGGAESFPCLKVSVCREIVPIGLTSCAFSFANVGERLSPDKFHEQVSKARDSQPSDVLLLDCRNYYESRIGRFVGAVAPDIRKFSYFPEFVEQNRGVFKDKCVYMYCTGGIRCEKASAYLKSKGVCRDVFQLSGGIHKYLEQYPDGFFQGKLYVFDERKTICTSDQIISSKKK
ncbi:thiosulfate sulfurtransferase/rhodanese-like domain-containing protein 2 isoform X2 [Corticium candelabrum]|uniref:thiosulfate sulfurtransferase/rhodanese-like domain-containing protein 2 isoform X2 n=1 Tax=Corticium candelabrum TaxID=121492 RepID=UPI002E26DD0A|nr:thiosulfate sulfurtransferase/rhodanese-like domain-containing protein 2 isoform X2 [Corticium candelabrum]